MKSAGFRTSLVGRMAASASVEEDGRRRSDGNGALTLWPFAQPNASGEFIAEIVGAWVDKDGAVKLALCDPFGATGEAWLTHVRLLPK